MSRPAPPAKETQEAASMVIPAMMRMDCRASVMIVPGSPPSMVKARTSTAERIRAGVRSMPNTTVQMVDMAMYCMAVVGIAYTTADSSDGMMPTVAPYRWPNRSARV